MELQAHQVTLQQIPRGDQGVRITVSKVAELIRQGSFDPNVRVQRDLLDFSTVEDKIPFTWSAAYMDQVFKFARTYPFAKDSKSVAGLFPELDDPRRVELLRSAPVIISYKGMELDCDDYSILIGALAKAAGIPVRLVVIAANPRRPKKLTHVYPEVKILERWIAMDAVLARPGDYHPDWTRRIFINV